MDKVDGQDVIDEQIKTLIREFGLRRVATGLNNACVHGEVFDAGNIDDIDENRLKELYAIIDNLINFSKNLS